MRISKARSLEITRPRRGTPSPHEVAGRVRVGGCAASTTMTIGLVPRRCRRKRDRIRAYLDRPPPVPSPRDFVAGGGGHERWSIYPGTLFALVALAASPRNLPTRALCRASRRRGKKRAARLENFAYNWLLALRRDAPALIKSKSGTLICLDSKGASRAKFAAGPDKPWPPFAPRRLLVARRHLDRGAASRHAGASGADDHEPDRGDRHESRRQRHHLDRDQRLDRHGAPSPMRARSARGRWSAPGQ
jgi:hypothetical protein